MNEDHYHYSYGHTHHHHYHHCYQYCYWELSLSTAEGSTGSGCADRTASAKKRRVLGQDMLPMPASRLAYDISLLEAISLQNAPKRWSPERCNKCLSKVMAALTVRSHYGAYYGAHYGAHCGAHCDAPYSA